jgi:hypothetical protein
MVELRHVHLVVKNHLLRYLKGTIDYGLRYVLDHKISLQGYTDSNWADSVTERKNTSGCCFGLGLAMISWFNRTQTSVVLSTDKEEYKTTFSTSNKAMWLQKMLSRLLDLKLEATCIWCDN